MKEAFLDMKLVSIGWIHLRMGTFETSISYLSNFLESLLRRLALIHPVTGGIFASHYEVFTGETEDVHGELEFSLGSHQDSKLLELRILNEEGVLLFRTTVDRVQFAQEVLSAAESMQADYKTQFGEPFPQALYELLRNAYPAVA